MHINVFVRVIIIFISAVIAIPILATLMEKLVVFLGQPSRFSHITKSVCTFSGWLSISIVILTGIGFDLMTLVQAALVVLGMGFGVAVIFGFPKDVLLGISLASDDNFREGVAVEIIGSVVVKGRILEIGLLRTKIVSEDGKLYVLPNRIFQDTLFSILSTHDA